jgi:hypothetical protein
LSNENRNEGLKILERPRQQEGQGMRNRQPFVEPHCAPRMCVTPRVNVYAGL